MRLLFITQKVDRDDDFLGVYHEWIRKLAEKVERINVICLYRGKTELPNNIHVYSLGKEKSETGPPTGGRKFEIIKKFIYVINFYKYIWNLRGEYDKVFVHMNPEYVILGWKLWKLLGKRIFLWYNHPLGGLKARLAIFFANTVFHTSPQAFASRYQKAMRMPVGIDTDKFRKLPMKKIKNSILYLGRISPIKNLEILIKAAEILDGKGVDFFLAIFGDPSKPSEYEYAKNIKQSASLLVNKKKIQFFPSVPNNQTPTIYNQYEISVNLTPSGSFDKTIIEAITCGAVSVASNKAMAEIFPENLQNQLMFKERDAGDLAEKLDRLLQLNRKARLIIADETRALVVEKHSLRELISRFFIVFND